jgi:glycosyltransferase involved in cell wall biosynthesis
LERLLVFQYGDYGAAWRRLSDGLPETYRDQNASVELVAGLSTRFHVTTLSVCDRSHREEVAPGLWSIGIDEATAYSARRILPLLAELAPDRMIVRMPHRYALLWARWRGVPTLPVFADIFGTATLRQRLENRLLRWALSGPNVPCVSNHSLNASLSMQTVLGLAPGRIVPWDRPSLTPDPQAKPAASSGCVFRAFYAGLVVKEKGIGDCLEASALLAARNLRLEIDFAGTGDLQGWTARAEVLGIADRIRFLGMAPNEEIRARMRAADLVLVPSRHDYAEGLPNTLCEALAARTPVVISDHPAFASRLQNDRDCLMFRAADPEDLAAQIERLMLDGGLQTSLSERSPAALASLKYGWDWFSLIAQYADDPNDATGWVASHCIS